MLKTFWQILLGLAMCTLLGGCVVYSSLYFPWEARNLDGSSSITWHSGIVLLVLIAATQWMSSWTFRRGIALQVFLGLGLSMLIAALVLNSSFSFSWEARTSEGIFSLTWRSDALILLILAVPQALSFLTFGWTRRVNPIDHDETPPGIRAEK
jgi:hypothetical protein